MFQDLNPLDKPTATMEIIIMLLVAALLGYLLHYMMGKLKSEKVQADLRFKEDTISSLNKRNDLLTKDNADLERIIIDIRNSKKELVTEIGTLKNSTESAELKINGINMDKIGEEIETLQRSVKAHEEENVDLKRKLLALENNNTSEVTIQKLEEKIKILELDRTKWIEQKRVFKKAQVEHEKKAAELKKEAAALAKEEQIDDSEENLKIEDLRTKVEELSRQRKALESELKIKEKVRMKERKKFFEKKTVSPEVENFQLKKKTLLKSIGKSSESEKDNLAEIVGIGPFIEAKLNSIGVFSYEQVTRLKEEEIALVTELIEFFPGRIDRDDWVSQANELMEKEKV